MSELPLVSVVIPSYNDGTYIDRLLEALSRQTYSNLEVIVSDAQSKDGTAEVVRRFEDKLKLTLVETPPNGPSAGRNEGAKRARGEWLLFLDADDDLPDTRFVEILVGTAEQKGWGTASAKIRHSDATPLEQLGSWLNYYYIRVLAHTKHPVAPGWCILVRRKLFEKYNGFNEKIHFGEDYDLVTRIGGPHGFGFVTNTYYFVDLRRARSEGFGLFVKGTKNEIYRFTHHFNLENNPNTYEFGHHEKRDAPKD